MVFTKIGTSRNCWGWTMQSWNKSDWKITHRRWLERCHDASIQCSWPSWSGRSGSAPAPSISYGPGWTLSEVWTFQVANISHNYIGNVKINSFGKSFVLMLTCLPIPVFEAVNCIMHHRIFILIKNYNFLVQRNLILTTTLTNDIFALRLNYHFPQMLKYHVI